MAFVWVGTVLLMPYAVKAQDFKVTGKADFMSDYIWRGAYQNSGFSVQPTLGLAYGNLSLSAWGSQSLTKSDGAQEFDINLSYTLGNGESPLPIIGGTESICLMAIINTTIILKLPSPISSAINFR